MTRSGRWLATFCRQRPGLGELLEQALRHKMLRMLAHHIISSDLRFDVPMSIYHHLESALDWNRSRSTCSDARQCASRRGLLGAVFSLWSPA